MLEVLLILFLAFAVVWTWFHKERIESFDDFIEMKWLFRSRRKKIGYRDVSEMVAERGVCAYRGQARPWTSTVCECTGYVYSHQRRGTAYCRCGDQRIVHRFKVPGSSSSTSPPGSSSES